MTNSRAVNSKVYLFSCTAHSLSVKINLSSSGDTLSIISIVGLKAAGAERARRLHSQEPDKSLLLFFFLFKKGETKDRITKTESQNRKKTAAALSRSFKAALFSSYMKGFDVFLHF